MRERFSALIRKPGAPQFPNPPLSWGSRLRRAARITSDRAAVYTFKFDRFRTVTPDTYRKLVRARNSRAIVVTTPVDVKAFFLKCAVTPP
jgi:hypothetical protein